ncbi:MAG: hypothetical protein WAK48_18250 [Candidatus Acidiferrum sp.]|jgi:hypothetical protein
MPNQWVIIRILRGLLVAVPAIFFCLAGDPALAARDPSSCSANAQSREFDFWVGDWDVRYPGAENASSSKVYLELGKCVLVENWDGGKGHEGINIFAYSADDQHWHGLFADNEGRVHVFEGKVSGGAAEFIGPSRGAKGETDLNRIRVTRLGADRVEQTWEKSSDNGASWNIVFRGAYSRKSAGAGVQKPGK